MIKLLLETFGLPASSWEKGFASLLGRGKDKRVSPVRRERDRFRSDVHDQLVELKKKGLSIPIFTL